MNGKREKDERFVRQFCARVCVPLVVLYTDTSVAPLVFQFHDPCSNYINILEMSLDGNE